MNKLLILVGILLVSFSFRLWNLNQAGRTWDEFAYVDTGYKFIELLKKGDLKNPYWVAFPDHPPVAKYIYGIGAHFDVSDMLPSGQPVYHYDWVYSRLFSVLFSVLTVVLVYLIAIRYLSLLSAAVSSTVFSFLPLYLAFSQLVTIETILVFFFTATVYSWLLTTEKPTWRRVILSGILLGFTLGVKFTNVLIIPVCLSISVLWFLLKEKKLHLNHFSKIMTFLCIGGVVFILLWPAVLFHTKEFITSVYEFRLQKAAPPIELFAGVYGPVPKTYYLVYFLITTPPLILLLFAVGLFRVLQKRSWIYFAFLIWFCIPFIQSFYPLRQNGIRYIIEIYVPFALIAAIGFEYLVGKITKNVKIALLYFVPIFFYCVITAYLISPYYLNYFNIFVGGPKSVYENKSYMLNWWGEGQREAFKYLAFMLLQVGDNTVYQRSDKNRIGLAAIPKYVAPPVRGLHVEEFQPKQEYDYVVINYLYTIRNKYNESELRKKYNLVYSVQASGAPIVNVYQHK